MSGSAIGLLERKAWARVFNDGIFDIYLGVLFLDIAVWLIAADREWSLAVSAAPAVILLVLALVFYRVAKERVTAPRMGRFKIEPRRTKKMHVTMAIGVGVTVLLVAGTVLGGLGVYPSGLPLALVLFAIVAMQAVTMFSLGAYFTGVRRFYVYGLLCLTGFLGAEILVVAWGLGEAWTLVGLFGLPAAVLICVGCVLLIRFLREYPVREAG